MAAAPLPTLIDYYEAIERASADMLEAARAGDWDGVLRLEGACTVLIAQLKQAAATQSLAAAERRRKASILQRIVIADAEIRVLCEPAPLFDAPRVLH